MEHWLRAEAIWEKQTKNSLPEEELNILKDKIKELIYISFESGEIPEYENTKALIINTLPNLTQKDKATLVEFFKEYWTESVNKKVQDPDKNTKKELNQTRKSRYDE